MLKDQFLNPQRLFISLATVLVLFFVNNTLQAQTIAGSYKISEHATQSVPKAGSLDRVKLVEVLSISCGYCYSFYKKEKKLFEAFKEKLDFSSLEIGWIGDNLSRFFYLADSYNKLYDAKSLLFSAFHEAGIRNINDPKVLEAFARELKFPANYAEDLTSPDINNAIKNSIDIVKQFRVQSTPTFIIEDSIIVVGADEANLAKVINSLLKKPIEY